MKCKYFKYLQVKVKQEIVKSKTWPEFLQISHALPDNRNPASSSRSDTVPLAARSSSHGAISPDTQHIISISFYLSPSNCVAWLLFLSTHSTSKLHCRKRVGAATKLCVECLGIWHSVILICPEVGRLNWGRPGFDFRCELSTSVRTPERCGQTRVRGEVEWGGHIAGKYAHLYVVNSCH